MSTHREEIMKRRLVVPLVALAISFALPTHAQQKDLADPQTTQKIAAIAKAYEEAENNNDAAAAAALYKREPIPIKGHWLWICVREGDDWRIRASGWSI